MSKQAKAKGAARPSAARGSTRAPRTGRKRPVDHERLAHELEVHQAELETQNEELRRARGELEVALARYTDLFDFAPIGYATLDAGDVIRNINLVGADLLGRTRLRLIGARFAAAIARDSLPAFAATAARVRATEEPAVCEVHVHKDDALVVLHVTATTRPGGCLLLAFEDITERKHERELLAETERELRATAHRKDEFLAMLSHELRNPLAPIHTSLFVLKTAEIGSPAWSEAREIIERQTTHLTRLVDDLLDVTRLSRGKVRLKCERVDLRELVRRTVDDHRSGFEAAGITLASTETPDGSWVDVDPARIEQVLSNLLANAQKFTPAGGRVDVDLHRRDNRRVALRVRDTGAGIAPELLPHVFEAFTQGPQASDRGRGGLGLGLAMVKGLVELHGGVVDLASDGVGRGTEVSITLPLAAARTVTPEPALPPLPSRRVLVIEDQADTARVLKTALTLLGLEVRTASDGPAGFEVARSFRPEVVLCDIGLPGMDGHEVARAFRRDLDLRDTFLVALSGYAQPEDVERATVAGFSRHVAKPASLDTLARVIAEAP